jgi:membrane associated rhomboid family serine protease
VVLPLRDDAPTARVPVVTLAFVAACLAVYFLVQPSPDSTDGDRFFYEHAAIPCELRTGEPLTEVELVSEECGRTEPARVVDRFGRVATVGPTPVDPDKQVYVAVLWSMFLHGSVLHVLGNMLFLWIFGNNVEDRLGHVSFVVFYLFVGVAATLTHVVAGGGDTVPLVGASGAIAGVMGAYLVWFPQARVLTLLGWFVVELPAFVVLGLWFLMQFATNPNAGVAWLAHVGGFAAGVVIGLALSTVRPPRQPALAEPA